MSIGLYAQIGDAPHILLLRMKITSLTVESVKKERRKLLHFNKHFHMIIVLRCTESFLKSLDGKCQHKEKGAEP